MSKSTALGFFKPAPDKLPGRKPDAGANRDVAEFSL
jgi:hypothetical protein